MAATNVPPEFTVKLSDSESAVAFTRARVSRGATGGHTFLLVWVFIWIADAVRNRRQIRDVRERSAALGFPLDRNMAMVATTDRLLVWRTGRGGPTQLGQVARSEIASARLPYIGGGPWRTVELRMVNGVGIRFKVEAATAELFTNALDRA
jgi:hypothetical protein